MRGCRLKHLGWALFALGCHDHPATGLVLALSSDLRVPDQAAQLSLHVHRGNDPRYDHTFSLTGPAILPGTFTLERDGNDGPLTVEVTMQPEGQAPVVTRTAKVRFVDDKTKVLRLRMSVACIGKECGAEQTCVEGECVSAEIDATQLPGYESDTGALDPAGCFDPSRCTATPELLQRNRSDDPCSFGVSGAEGTFDVGLRWASDPTQVVFLAKGTGWSFASPSTVKLSGWACEALGSATMAARATGPYGVTLTEGCRERKAGVEVCAGAPAVSGAGGSGASGQGGAAPIAPLAASDGVSIGPRTSCAWNLAGRLDCWGSYASTYWLKPWDDYSYTPHLLPEVTNVVDVAIGLSSFTCALRSDKGGVACWGNNEHICPGGVVPCITGPVPIDKTSEAVRIAAAQDSACVLWADGSVHCWGGNLYGGLGDHSRTPSSTPILVSLPHRAVAIFGRAVQCALLDEGSVWCWGGTNVDDPKPPSPRPIELENAPAGTQVVEVTSIDLDVASRVFLRTDKGELWMASPLSADPAGSAGWGKAQRMDLPDEVPSLKRLDAAQATLGLIASDNLVWSADGASIMAGDKGVQLKPAPMMKPASALSVGADGEYLSTFCARLQDGSLTCWGGNKEGELGFHSEGSVETPQPVTVPGLDGLTVTASFETTVLSHANGAVFTCGTKGLWQDEDTYSPVAASQVKGPLYSVQAYSGPPVYASDGAQWQLLGSSDADSDPGQKLLAKPGLIQLASMGRYVRSYDLALGSAGTDGSVLWALPYDSDANVHGGLGIGSVDVPGLDPVAVMYTGSKIQSFSTGSTLSGDSVTQCLLNADSQVLCWGNNNAGQVNQFAGNPGAVTTPLPIVLTDPATSMPEQVSQVAAMALGACALTKSGKIYCWGDNGYGQLGRGDQITPSHGEAPLPTLDLLDPDSTPTVHPPDGLACGSYHCCAWSKQQPKVWCWGWNAYGEVGLGGHALIKRPTLLGSTFNDHPVLSMSMQGRGQTSCAVTGGATSGKRELWCWGDGYKGQLCLGTHGDMVAPGPVTLEF